MTSVYTGSVELDTADVKVAELHDNLAYDVEFYTRPSI